MPDYYLQPFTGSQEQYQWMVAINNRTYPHKKTDVTFWEHLEAQQVNAPYHYRRYLVEDRETGRVVLFGVGTQKYWHTDPSHYWINGTVALEEMTPELLGFFFDVAQRDFASFRPTAIFTMLREDWHVRVRFHEERGYRPILRTPVSHLAVQPFPYTQYEPLLNRLSAEGITIHPYTDLMARYPDAKTRFWRLNEMLSADVPQTGEEKPLSWEQFEMEILQAPDFLPAALFIALYEDAWIGMTSFWKTADPSIANTGLTGVLPSYRRRGIATALKAVCIRYAQQNGYELLETDNEEHNPMYQLNLQLGFVPQPAFVEYRLDLLSI